MTKDRRCIVCGGYKTIKTPVCSCPTEIFSEKDLLAFVAERFREGLKKTRESVRAARTNVLEAADDAALGQLARAEEFGCDIGRMEMVVHSHYNKELQVWEFERLDVQSEVTLEHPVPLTAEEETHDET